MSATEVMMREVTETYTTPEARAAYRAGMSTAFAICDEWADLVKKSNPGKRKGEASQVGEFGASCITSAANAIEAARALIHVPLREPT